MLILLNAWILIPFQVLWKGKVLKYRFIIICIKGDWPFLRAACGLASGYNCKDKCHRCLVAEPCQLNCVSVFFG